MPRRKEPAFSPEDLPPEERVRFGVWEATFIDALSHQRHEASDPSSLEDMLGIIATMQSLPREYVDTMQETVIQEMESANAVFHDTTGD